MRYAFVLLLVLFSTSSYASDDAKYIAQAKQFIADQFTDPDSTKFRKVHFYRRSIPPADREAPVVCGEVNSKNQYGGYIGYQRFIWLQGGGVILDKSRLPLDIDTDWQATLGKLWREYCGN